MGRGIAGRGLGRVAARSPRGSPRAGLPARARGAMLLRPVIGKLQHKRVVLASSSPRRREILSNAVSGRGRGLGVGAGPTGPGLVTRGARGPKMGNQNPS